MSTKIGHGHIYVGVEPFDVFAFAASLRPTFVDIAARLDARALIRGAIEAYDRALIRGEAPSDNPIRHAYREFQARQDELDAMGWRRASVQREHRPHEAAVSITRGDVSGKVLFLLHAEAGDYFDAFRARDDIEPYWYKTSTDELPDGVTREEYAERGREWDRALPGGDIKSNTVRIEFRDMFDSTMQRIASRDRTDADTQRLVDEATHTADRARVMVTGLIFSEWLATERERTGSEELPPNWASAIYDVTQVNRDALIELAAETIPSTAALLAHMLYGLDAPPSPDYEPLRAAVRDWLVSNPIGKD